MMVNKGFSEIWFNAKKSRVMFSKMKGCVASYRNIIMANNAVEDSPTS